MGYVILSPTKRTLPVALPLLRGLLLIAQCIDDEEEESTPPSSPPVPAARRGKFDDEEEDSDVCPPGPVYLLRGAYHV